jgi:hypothetical protein
MSLIIKKNTTFKIPRTPPISFLGLSLWLKADAGVTAGGISQIIISGFTGIYTGANGTYNYNYEENWWFHNSASYYINSSGNLIDDNDQTVIATNNNNFQGAWSAGNYFSTITFSDAGDSYVNGVYTRSDASGPFGTFTASGGKYISYDDNDGFWFTDGDFYRNYGTSLNVGNWEPENGEEPVPTAVNSTSVRNVGSPTSTTVAGNFVTAWVDQSVNGRNAVIEEGSAPGSLVEIDDKSFVSFSNTTMILPSISFVGTIFAVVRFNASSTEPYGSRILYQTGDFSAFQLTRGYDSTNNFYLQSVGDGVFSNAPTNNNTNYLIGATFNSSSASLFLNGTSVGSGPIEENSGAGDLYIGQGEPHKIAEMIVYNRVLTTPERQQVEAYLNQKYAIY